MDEIFIAKIEGGRVGLFDIITLGSICFGQSILLIFKIISESMAWNFTEANKKTFLFNESKSMNLWKSNNN
jgi:hypothetical protein